jgi:hypothetical protein
MTPFKPGAGPPPTKIPSLPLVLMCFNFLQLRLLVQRRRILPAQANKFNSIFAAF